MNPIVFMYTLDIIAVYEPSEFKYLYLRRMHSEIMDKSVNHII